MCGIFGMLSYRDPVDKTQVQSLTRTLRHRGPDDEGFYFSEPEAGVSVGLGHRRLSIIDLSPNGRQPMANEDGTVWIVYNGEIYDFQRTRRALMDRGHIFHSESDTEVILHLYEEYGTDCLKHLRGMFAFAIWDERQRALFAARDRLGKKPLYYASTPNGFYFSSEINPLLRIEGIEGQIDLEALDLYMTYSYIPSPHSIVKGISKLPPAHYLFHRQGKIEIERYWDLSYAPKLKVSFQDAQKLLADKIEEATRIRLYSDVPLGCFLSGGVDSSTVLAHMAALTSQPVRTFSIGFPDKSFDESPYASRAARHFGATHQAFMVKPTDVGMLQELVEHYGEPFGDASALPTWHLSELTRKHVTVALTGDGGDELFAGYNWHATAFELFRLSRFFPAHLAAFFLHGQNGEGAHSPLGRKTARLMSLLAKDHAHRFSDLRGQFPGKYKSALYSDHFKAQLRLNCEDYLSQLYESRRFHDELDRMLYVDTLSYLPEELLVKVDRATMAHSLEARSPLLDHELVELAACMPSHFKYRLGRKKRILKAMGRKLFPDGFLNRPKSGFSVPLRPWFSGDLESYARENLGNGSLKETGLFNMKGIEAVMEENKFGRRDHGDLIWRLLMLSKWFEKFT